MNKHTTPIPSQPSRRPAVVYVRVSSKEQEKEGYSIPAQKRLLRAYAQEQGLRVIRVFEDVETAKKAGRTAFNTMIEFLRTSPSSTTILVEKTDRLYRNIRDWVTLDDFDTEVHFVKENFVLSDDSRSSEKFFHGIRVLMAKNYIDNLSEECSKGMREKAREGYWPSFAPLGYLNVSGKHGKRVIGPDPDRAPVISRLFEHYASGSYSLDSLVEFAKREGLRTRRSSRRLGKTSLHSILRNPIYKGSFVWDGVLYEGKHTPLVSPALWSNVQQTLADRSRTKKKRTKRDLAYTGIITCGHCGCSWSVRSRKGSTSTTTVRAIVENAPSLTRGK